MLELIESGMSRTSARIVRSFLNYATRWNEESSSTGLATTPLTPIGASSLMCQNTVHPRALSSLVANWMDEMIGYETLVFEVENHS